MLNLSHVLSTVCLFDFSTPPQGGKKIGFVRSKCLTNCLDPDHVDQYLSPSSKKLIYLRFICKNNISFLDQSAMNKINLIDTNYCGR